VLASLARFQAWRTTGRVGNVLEDTIQHRLPGPNEEPGDTWLEAAKAASHLYRALAQLQEEDRWRDVYRCSVCSRWFYATRAPRDATRPLCGRKCWPSRQPIRSEGPTHRVTRRRTKAPP
jgi:hypothetical protein